ncbi:MAG: putative monovalent cation/H+ antiporter subunit A, partial [Pseudomonadota bacterium]
MTATVADGTFWTVLIPFLGAILAPPLVRQFAHNAAWPLAALPFLVFLVFLGYAGPVADGETFIVSVPWAPSLGVTFSFYIDGLSTVFALLISGIGSLIVIYAGGYLKGHEHLGRFISFIFLFMGAMLGLVLADNVITLFIFWELTSITSFLLIGFDHLRTASRRAALQALVVTGAGGLSLLAAVILMAYVVGDMSMAAILASGDVLRDSALYVPIFLLVLGGAFTKSAQFPLHFWLPNAMEAPTPVSAYLHSATMVKAGVYLLMRVHPVLGETVLWETVLPLFGGATLLAGTLLAVRQTDLKLMLAYTTVASLGLLVLLTGIGTETAIKGAVLYLFAHSLFKGALFMVAGTIDHEAGTRDVTRLGGLREAMPFTFAAACLAALSMAGFPPFIGFIAKEVLYEGMAYGSLWFIFLTVVAIVGNALMLVIGAAVALKPFLGPAIETPKSAHEGPLMLWGGPMTLALLGTLTGLLAGWTGYLLIAPMTISILGYPAEVEVYLIPHKILPPILSLMTILLGIAIYMRLDAARAAIARSLEVIGWGPDRGFDQAIRGIVSLSGGVTRLVQTGSLHTYMLATFVVIAAFLIGPLFARDWPARPDWPEMTFYEWGVLIIAVIGLWAVITARTRLVAIISLGIQGFAVALIFLLFGAPDLSFTQFMVETLSVVILALVMTRLNLQPHDRREPAQQAIDWAIAGTCGLGFALAMIAVAANPIDLRLSEFFIEYSRPIAHGRNIVNVILVDFRGLDTLGEIAVVMVAGLAVLALIRVRAKRRAGRALPRPDASRAVPAALRD